MDFVEDMFGGDDSDTSSDEADESAPPAELRAAGGAQEDGGGSSIAAASTGADGSISLGDKNNTGGVGNNSAAGGGGSAAGSGSLPPWCSWVVEGRVLAGPHPATIFGTTPDGLRALPTVIDTLRSLGVGTFVSLVPKYEEDFAVAPYDDVLPASCEVVHEFAVGNGTSPLTSDLPTRGLVALPDSDAAVLARTRRCGEFLAAHARQPADGDNQVAYVHCLGGRGRTGTVCAVALALLDRKLTGDGALSAAQAQYNSRHSPPERCPETAEQDEIVRRAISPLAPVGAASEAAMKVASAADTAVAQAEVVTPTVSMGGGGGGGGKPTGKLPLFAPSHTCLVLALENSGEERRVMADSGAVSRCVLPGFP